MCGCKITMRSQRNGSVGEDTVVPVDFYGKVIEEGKGQEMI